MNLLKKWNDLSLVIRILCGLVVGAVLGLALPSLSWISIFGTIFVGALKGIAPLLVFFLVISAISKGSETHGGTIRTVIILYMLSTLVAAIIAVIASMIFKVNMILPSSEIEHTAPQGVSEIIKALLLNTVSNPIHAIANANYIGTLAWACVIGLALRNASAPVKNALSEISDAISLVVKWIISFAPFGILGLVFESISSSGLEIFTSYGKLLLLLVGTMLFITFVTNPILVWWCVRKNPYPLVFKCLKRSALTAFFTRSSAANIPINMKVCEEMNLDKNTYSVTIPLGATINMDGAAVTITVMTLATVFTLGIPVDIPSAIILSLLATVAACGTSGIAGGSILLIPVACSLFGIPDTIAYQVVAIGFIIGVVQDSVETALNSSSDLLLSVSAELRKRRLEGKSFDMKELCK